MLYRYRLAALILMLLFAVNIDAKRDVGLWTDIRYMGVLYQQGQRDSAYSEARRLLITAQANDDALAQAVLHNFIGICLNDKGQKDAAQSEFRRCTAISEADGFLARAAKSELPIYYPTMLNAYSQLVLYNNEKGPSRTSLRYARTGMKWTEECKDAATRLPALSVFADELMSHKEYGLIYEPMKHGVQDALHLNKPDIALSLTAHIIYIERNVMGRDLKDIPWVKVGRDLMTAARTETAKTEYLMAVSDAIAKTTEQAKANVHSDSVTTAKEQSNNDSTDVKSPVTAAREKARVEYVKVRNERVAVAVVVLLVVVVGLLIYFLIMRRRRKQDAMRAEQEKDERYREGQETERGRLARELHDGVSNQLLAVEMKLNEDGITPQTLQLLSESREQVRRVSHQLIPPEFEHTTLDVVLSNYCSELNGVRNCDISYSSSPADADWTIVTKEQALEVYRIVQELTSNILKHTSVTEIAIGMHLRERTVTIIISDNAPKPTESNDSSGIGKLTVRQRIEAIGGTMETFPHKLGNVVRMTIALPSGV